MGPLFMVAGHAASTSSGAACPLCAVLPGHAMPADSQGAAPNHTLPHKTGAGRQPRQEPHLLMLMRWGGQRVRAHWPPQTVTMTLQQRWTRQHLGGGGEGGEHVCTSMRVGTRALTFREPVTGDACARPT